MMGGLGFGASAFQLKPMLPQIRRSDSTVNSSKVVSLVLIPKRSTKCVVSRTIFSMRNFHCRSAAASSAASGAEYSSERLLGTETKLKRRSVAGIDQDDLLDPETLADTDSCFCNFKGVQIHHKLCFHEETDDPSILQLNSDHFSKSTKKIGLPLILLHGFGASVFSWNRVMKPLASIVGAKVLSFDRPAFGLTSRVNLLNHHSSSSSGDASPLNPYSMAFSVLATLSFIDNLNAEKAILMGHSAGCLVAVNTYFEAPERIAALILIAPAIFAPLVSHQATQESKLTESRTEANGDPDSNVETNIFLGILKTVSNFYKYILKLAVHLMKGMMDMVASLYRKALTAILRSKLSINLVRMIIDKFGISAIRNAWSDPSQINDDILHGYTKPLRVKGWERALLEYTLAMLTDSMPGLKPSLARRLAEISCPVLIITGDRDRLVPSWNAKRLSQAIPGSVFELIMSCGHLPHEEKVEEFLAVVERFLRTAFSAQQLQPLHATA